MTIDSVTSLYAMYRHGHRLQTMLRRVDLLSNCVTLACNMAIVSLPQIAVTSLHPVYLQKDLEEMSDFLVIKSTEEQRAEGVENPVDTAYIDDRDGLPILKAVFDIRHFRPDDVSITVEDTSGEPSDSGAAQRQLVLFAQLTDDSRECSLFKKVYDTI